MCFDDEPDCCPLCGASDGSDFRISDPTDEPVLRALVQAVLSQNEIVLRQDRTMIDLDAGQRLAEGLIAATAEVKRLRAALEAVTDAYARQIAAGDFDHDPERYRAIVGEIAGIDKVEKGAQG